MECQFFADRLGWIPACISFHLLRTIFYDFVFSLLAVRPPAESGDPVADPRGNYPSWPRAVTVSISSPDNRLFSQPPRVGVAREGILLLAGFRKCAAPQIRRERVAL